MSYNSNYHHHHHHAASPYSYGSSNQNNNAPYNMGAPQQQSPIILNNQHQHPVVSNGASVSAATAGPRAKCDQVVYEALCKACEIIVGSRTTSSSTTTSGGANTTSTPRFNLQIPEVSGVRTILSQYRLQLHVPIRLDVYYQHPPNNNNNNNNNNPEESPRRELLERWCLEYKPTTHLQHHHHHQYPQQSNSNNNNTSDPMVQLTQVCKRVVVWLRTLYCWTRLLPASALTQQQQQQQPRYNSNSSSIGFAIYINTDGNQDDVTDLTTRQGFISNSNSSNRGGSSSGGTIVLTPYGELSWQVVHAPASQLERHLPPPIAMRTVRMQLPLVDAATRSGTSSRPIPLPRSNHHHHHHSDYHGNNNNNDDATMMAPHSAPLHGGAAGRALTYTERSHQKQWEAQQQQQNRRSRQPFWQSSGKSFDPSGLLHSSRQQQQQQQQNAPTTTMPHHHRASPARTPPMKSSANENPPRVMSGLSLALLMASNDDDHLMDSPTTAPRPHSADDNSNNDVSPDDSAVVMVYSGDGEEETAEEAKRRAALHQVPPHLLPQSNTGEYGYGYNNHIPWQKIHPSQSHPTNTATTASTSVSRQNSFGRTLSSSPGSFSASPLRSPPTPPALCSNTPKLDSFAHLIPPRNSRGTESKSGSSNNNNNNNSIVLPPFPPRPAGFLKEAASLERSGHTMGLMMGTTAAAAGGEEMNAFQLAASPVTKERTSSLDLLRSSPFAASSSVGDPQQQQMIRDSLLASTADTDLLRRSLWTTAPSAAGGLTSSTTSGAMFSTGAAFPNYPPHPLDPPVDHDDTYWSEEMPFAVELLPSPQPASSSTSSTTLPGKSTFGAGGSSYLGHSAAATLAQKCATGQHHPRLKLLDSSRISSSSSSQQLNAHSDSLADQLQELRAFGASLRLGGATEEAGSLSGSGSSAAANPIVLRS